MSAALEVRDLTVGYHMDGGAVNVVVRDLSFDLHAGRLLGLAGESGSGKSTAALAAIGYTAPGSVRLGGSARLDDVDLLTAPIKQLRRLWGSRIAFVAQDASQSLSPLMRVEGLLAEPLRLHLGLRGAPLRSRLLTLLEDVGIPDPEVAIRRYPYQFSGGQQQRIALAIAMACEPTVLILDEPTTGLDVTTQAQISRLVNRLVIESGTAAVVISHDLALLGNTCDEMVIMYAGEAVERTSAAEMVTAPRHPYTAALLDAVPRVDESGLVVGIPGLAASSVAVDTCAFAPRCRFAEQACSRVHPDLQEVSPGHDVRCLRTSELGVLASRRHVPVHVTPAEQSEALLDVRGLVCSYRGSHERKVVDGVNLRVNRAETVALVGESGSGKSTVLRAIAGLHRLDTGSIAYNGVDLPVHTADRSRDFHREIQIIFQDPHASLNPRHTIGEIIGRPITLFFPERSAVERREQVVDLLHLVQLDPRIASRRPHQLSGGQKQRVAIARAFAAEPRLLLCDEIVSALDVSVQASILELMAKLTADTNTAVLFVTHDLAVVRSIAERVYVMQAGLILEDGPTERVFEDPHHTYTQELLAAVPRLAMRGD